MQRERFYAYSQGAAGAAQTRPTFSAFWLGSSVVSVLISVTTDMSPTGNLIVTLKLQCMLLLEIH